MIKILVDTNKLLDFYRYKTENNEILEKLSSSNNIIITDQIIREFKRNRILVIKNLLDGVSLKKKNLTRDICNLEAVGIFSKDISDINSLNSELLDKIKSNFKPLEEKINSMLSDEKNDDVLKAFNNIISNKNTLIIKDSDSLYESALKRNNLGGVPRSEKSGFKSLTICDEYIWESLLQFSNYDVIFVTRDKTYLDNSAILKEEYKKKTGKNIEFLENVSIALNKSGEDISKEAIEKEKRELKILRKFNDIFNRKVDNLEEFLIPLTVREEEIIKFRYGYDDGEFRSLDEVAAKYGISREDVRQMEARAFYKMKRKFDSSRFSD